MVGKLNNQFVKIIVDTGSVYNVVGLSQTLDRKQSMVKMLRAAGGHLIPVLGSTALSITIDTWTTEIAALVVPDLPCDIILGIQFLVKNQAVIDFNEKIITFWSDIKINFNPCNEEKIDAPLDRLCAHLYPTRESTCAVLKEFPYAREAIINNITDKFILSDDVIVPGNAEIICRLNGSSEINVNNNISIHSDVKEKLGVGVLNLCPHESEVGIWTAKIKNISRTVPRKLFKHTALAYNAFNTNTYPYNNQSIDIMVMEDEGTTAHNINNELTSEQQEALEKLINEFSDIFAWHSKQIGLTDIVEHEIHTGDAAPIHQRPYRVSHKEREIIQQQVKEMLDDNIIRPSFGTWSSPVVLVKKKDNTWRFCVDYRKLNAVTKSDVYPLPVIEDILSYLGDSKYFTSLDLFSGYWQVPIKECDKVKTAFITPDGHFEFNVLSFGLCSAPATFQHLADTVFRDLKWKEVLIYLDDVIIYSKTFEEHLIRLRHVFERLRTANLTLKPSKCL